MAIIKQLKDENGEAFYPQTVREAVSDWDATNIEVVTSDPGEGSPLADGEFIAVVGDPECTVQSGSFSFTIAAGATDSQSVALPTALTSSDYQVFLQPMNLAAADCGAISASPASRSGAAFTVNLLNSSTAEISGIMAWLAVKVG